MPLNKENKQTHLTNEVTENTHSTCNAVEVSQLQNHYRNSYENF